MPVRAESFVGTGRTFQFVACSSLESEPRCFGGCLSVPCGVTASVGQSFSAVCLEPGLQSNPMMQHGIVFPKDTSNTI